MADRRDVEGQRGVDGPGRQSPLLRRWAALSSGPSTKSSGRSPCRAPSEPDDRSNHGVRAVLWLRTAAGSTLPLLSRPGSHSS